MNILRHVQAVLWSFVGLGRREGMNEMERSGNPLMLIVIGFAMAAVFVAVLLELAGYAVSALSPGT